MCPKKSDCGDWQADQLLTDRYRVRKCLRISSTCHLWRVEDVFRQVPHLALRPGPAVTAQAGWREWFEHYCDHVLSVLPHPNVVTAERIAQESGVPFLVLEDADGQCWDVAIAERKLLHVPEMLDVAIQCADGLAWLHSQGRIHYNMKPGNVIICTSGVVKLWRYGEPSARTRAYASPEQMDRRKLSEATDVWSWAASVLHMFYGKVAWPEGPAARRALRRYRQNGPADPGIALMPGALMELLGACLMPDPGERRVGMGDVVQTLEGIYEAALGSSYGAPASGVGGSTPEDGAG